MVEEEEEPAAPAQHVGAHPGPEQRVVEEELVVSNEAENTEGRNEKRSVLGSGLTCVNFQMAGNPDQQEDTLDDQYQEEVEDEVCNTCENDTKEKKTHLTPKTILYVGLHSGNISILDQTINKMSHLIAVLKAPEDNAGAQKRDEVEEEGEDLYNEENIEQVSLAVKPQKCSIILPLP